MTGSPNIAVSYSESNVADSPLARIDLPAPDFLTRVWAALVDGLIEGVIGLIFFSLNGGLAALNSKSSARSVHHVILDLNPGPSLLLHTAYLLAFYHFYHATPGKLIFGLRVIDQYSGKYIGPVRVLIRELLLKRIGLVFIAGSSMISSSENGQYLHDRLIATKEVVID